MLPFPDKKYQIIYADPPWYYKNYANQTASRWVGNQYFLMSEQDICNLPINNIAADNCILFLWITAPQFETAFKVINAWGFKYKTLGFCWVKKNKKKDSFFWGMGYWTRSNVELCLIAVKGRPKRINTSIHQIVYSPIEKHSKKPDIVRDKIVKLVGDLPRIELFAREWHFGWDAWGDEIKEKD